MGTYASESFSSLALEFSVESFFFLVFLDFAFSRRLRRKPETVIGKRKLGKPFCKISYLYLEEGSIEDWKCKGEKNETKLKVGDVNLEKLK